MPRIAKALFSPSFDPETTLRVIADSDGTTMELTSSWRRFTHKNIVAPNSALRFWTELDAMLAAPFIIEKSIGLDGITIEVDCRTPAGSANFEVWSPNPTTRAGRLVGLIYDMAWEVFTIASAVECLEQLHDYVRDELPARIIDGPITRLRLFGSLTSSHQEPLRRLLARMLHTRSLLVDMTNCCGMGTLLYDAFIEFAASHPHLAFATSPNARQHLEAMQLSPERMYDRVEDAIRFLETNG